MVVLARDVAQVGIGAVLNVQRPEADDVRRGLGIVGGVEELRGNLRTLTCSVESVEVGLGGRALLMLCVETANLIHDLISLFNVSVFYVLLSLRNKLSTLLFVGHTFLLLFLQ